MKMTFLWLGILCLCLSSAHAQSNLAPEIKAVFEHLDKTSMQTEFLINQGYHLIQTEEYDGFSTNDSIGTNSSVSDFMYSGLLTSREFYSKTYLSSAQVDDLQETYLDQNIFPLGLVNMSIDKMNPQAFENDDVYVQDDKLYNIVNPSTSIFTSGDFVFLMPGVNNINESSLNIVVPSALYISNKTTPISLEIKLASQSNFIPISFDIPFVISNLQEGGNLIIVRITHGSETRLCRFVVEFEQPQIDLNLVFLDSRDYNLEPNIKETVEGVELYIYYDNEDTDCGENQISKPLIFIEGFDPNNIISINSFNGIINRFYEFPSGNQTLRNVLEEAGYDLIFVNWKVGEKDCDNVPNYTFNNGEASMFDNTERVKSVIRWVNEQKRIADSYEENILIGASMGGIVSKLALLQMEAANEDHENRIFVTLDSPLKGANIPLGLQAFVYDFNDLSIAGRKLSEDEDLGPSLRNGLHSITSPAAREQLFYHYGAHQEGLGISYWHDEFYNIFDSYGDLEVEHLAIANGAQNGIGQLFDPGDLLLNKFFDEEELITAEGLLPMLVASYI